MKKAILIELAWLAGLFVVAYLLCRLIVSNEALDIQAHDTYYITNGAFLSQGPSPILLFYISLAFCAYLGKAIYYSLKRVSINLVLIVLAALSLYYIDIFCQMLFSPNYEHFSKPGPTTYPSFTHIIGYYASIVNILKMILIFILAALSFITGYYYHKSHKAQTY